MSKAKPKADDLAGWNRVIQQMHAGQPRQPAPEPKAPRYTVAPGCYIYQDGRPLMCVARGMVLVGGKPLIEAERLTARIADLLNQHGEG